MIALIRKSFHFCAWNFVVVLISTKDSLQVETNQPNSFILTEGQPTSYYFFHQSEYPRDCEEVRRQCSSANSSGIYAIKPDGYPEAFDVYCDSDGYTVIARRLDGEISFSRSWGEYASGFGFLSNEFWLGNQRSSYLTNQKRYLLRIDVTVNDGSTIHATYDEFRLSDAYSNYTLISAGQFNIDGGWRYWTPWTPCSVTCGGGVKRRHGRCTDGAACVEDIVEEAVCNTQDCIIHGGWSEWSDWTVCPVTCDGGLQARERECNDPAPQYGGRDCTGDAQQNRDCGIDRCPPGSIRLANGPNSYSGRVEVFLNGQWGTVCDDCWYDDSNCNARNYGTNNGNVACRQLGFTGGVASVHAWATYGAGVGPIHMDNVRCSGSEARLADCPRTSSHNCGHDEDVGVVCRR